jgi:hypothetical protein
MLHQPNLHETIILRVSHPCANVEARSTLQSITALTQAVFKVHSCGSSLSVLGSMPSKDAEMADAEGAAPAAEAAEEREKGSSKEHKHKHKSRDKDRDRERHKSHKSSSRRDKDRDRERDKSERSRQRSSERDRVEPPRDVQTSDAAQQREDSPLEGDVPVPGIPAAAAEADEPAQPPVAEQNGAAAPGAFQQSTEGAEVSMSIEETNKCATASAHLWLPSHYQAPGQLFTVHRSYEGVDSNAGCALRWA